VGIRGAAAVGKPDRSAAEIGQWSAGAVAALLLLAAALVGWRRLAGALSSPLHPPLLLAAGAAMAVAAVGVRLAWRRLSAGNSAPLFDWLMAILPSSAVLALAAALSLPGTAAGGLAAFWAVLAVGEILAWQPLVRRRLPGRSKAAGRSHPVRLDPPETVAAGHRPARPLADVPPGDVLQQLTRSRAADGSEQLSGRLRAAFSAGQRSGSIHVAFCPPFARSPELAVEQLDGPPTRIKTAQLLPYGVRLDLKLTATAEAPQSVLVEFSARSKG